MNGRAAGVGFQILMGGYLLYKYLPQSELFNEAANARLATVLSALGAFLLILALVFLFRNLK